MEEKCTGSHEIFVAEVIGVEAEGTVTLVTICRHCEKVGFHTKQITSDPLSKMRMLKAENTKGT